MNTVKLHQYKNYDLRLGFPTEWTLCHDISDRLEEGRQEYVGCKEYILPTGYMAWHVAQNRQSWITDRYGEKCTVVPSGRNPKIVSKNGSFVLKAHEPKRPQGRPWPEDRVKHVRADISLPPHLKEKLMALGGSHWVVEQLELAEEPV